jgi:hypothetical protein
MTDASELVDLVVSDSTRTHRIPMARRRAEAILDHFRGHEPRGLWYRVEILPAGSTETAACSPS